MIEDGMVEKLNTRRILFLAPLLKYFERERASMRGAERGREREREREIKRERGPQAGSVADSTD